MKLVDIITKMDQLKDQLDNLRPIREDYLHKLNQKLRLDWNYHSNSIEGNTLSMSETRSFILWGVTAKGKPFRDYLEMKGHNEALNQLYHIVHQEIKITESIIKDLHKKILVEPYLDSNAEITPGDWKKIPNYLYSPTGERIDFAPPEDVPKLMSNLINWLNNHIAPPKRKKKKYDLHPLLIAAGFHSQFIKIHPFGDGNGRMSRILTNLILMLCGYVPAIIKLEKRNEYYTAINTSSLDNPENLAIHLGLATIHSLEIAIKAAKGENIEEPDDLDKQLSLLENKINNTGAEIKKLKSLATLKEFGDNNLILIASKFMTIHKKFSKFYINSFFEIKYTTKIPIEKDEYGGVDTDEFGDVLYQESTLSTSINPQNIKNKLIHAVKNSSQFLMLDVQDSRNAILFSYNFGTFARTEVSTFDYVINLSISFDKTHFIITTQTGEKHAFLYHIELQEEDLDNIIKKDANQHLKFIQNKIEN
ncbi:Fic family protein [Aureispira anguillae]|uniref:Fic family protein n=1 Tax=Aureispira anguillae TaxID=2864201 RepID=A0A916DTW9_9BACT|nr:Fic family protein [Aureispira anguillae]BDS12162.1 Fic family protein [Aureispira anguillae]